MASKSGDGHIITRWLENNGYLVTRGSTTRGGSEALRQMVRQVRGGHNVALTVDGPRGPAYQLGRGIIFLAQKSGAQIQPINIEYSSCWRARSWDKFILPRPFSRARVIFGPLLRVAPTNTEEEFEAERRRLQNAMMAQVEMR